MDATEKKPLDVVALSDVGVDAAEAGQAGARTLVLELGTPPARGSCTRVDDESQAAQAIVEFLADRQLI